MADGAGGITFRVQAFVVDHAGLKILIDPCVGNHKRLTLPFWNDLDLPWLDDLGAAGYEPGDIDLVIHTHLHEDHIGWDTHLVDGVRVPTFPNARHVYVGNELEWAATDERNGPGRGQEPFTESIAPVIDAGLSVQVDADADLGDGLHLVSTPGHTPGHTSLAITTTAEPLVITGDVLHHPFQLASPDLPEVGDLDPDMARATRNDFFAEHAHSGAVIAGTHFPVAPVGRFAPDGARWRFDPIAAS
jgi:glyoxylase-like metal-dependent hydrolase (beta-lactamase superfamily II)